MPNSDYELIRQMDDIAAEIYRDKFHYGFSYTEIAKLRSCKSSFVKMKFATAKGILKYRERQWLSGLSKRAQNALLSAGFISKTQVKEIINKGIVDLEELPNIGLKTRKEIRKWLNS